MLGPSHMVVGAAGSLAIAPTVAEITGHHITPVAAACTAVVGAGYALSPDMDTRNSTMGGDAPLLATLTGKLFGGHRHGTHSFLFCGLVAALTSFALVSQHVVRLPIRNIPHHLAHAHVTVGTLFAALIGFYSLWLLLDTVLGVRNRKERAGLALALVVIGVVLRPGSWWLPWAAGLGALLHLFADWLTPEGIVPFWPFWNRRFSLPDTARATSVPVLGALLRLVMIERTGDAHEAVIVLAIGVGGLLLGWQEIAPAAHHAAVAAAHH